jgi:hypothetical protein
MVQLASRCSVQKNLALFTEIANYLKTKEIRRREMRERVPRRGHRALGPFRGAVIARSAHSPLLPALAEMRRKPGETDPRRQRACRARSAL